MALDSALWVGGLVAEAALVLLLVRIRAYRALPAFFICICWSLVSDSLMLAFLSLPPVLYFRLYEAQMILDSAMIFAVLVELAWCVLRPIRKSLPRESWIGIALLIALAGVMLWPVAGLTLPYNLNQQGVYFFRLQQTFALLRVLVFLGMAGFSQVLSIGWRDREFQVATGLGFYSIVSLAVSIFHTHQAVGAPYHWLDEVVMTSYVGALIYWVFSFATKEAERREFTPEMEHLLLTVAGGAHRSRGIFTPKTPAKERRPE